jgi:hypothetical protein
VTGPTTDLQDWNHENDDCGAKWGVFSRLFIMQEYHISLIRQPNKQVSGLARKPAFLSDKQAWAEGGEGGGGHIHPAISTGSLAEHSK